MRHLSPSFTQTTPPDLDLSTDGVDQFYGAGPQTAGFSTLWGLAVVESISATEGS